MQHLDNSRHLKAMCHVLKCFLSTRATLGQSKTLEGYELLVRAYKNSLEYSTQLPRLLSNSEDVQTPLDHSGSSLLLYKLK